MVSQAQSIRLRLNDHINLDELEWLRSLDEFSVDALLKEFKTIMAVDFKLLAEKLNRHGLNDKYRRLLDDIPYRMQQAYLHPNDRRVTKDQKITCVVGRMLICRHVCTELFGALKTSIESLSSLRELICKQHNFSRDQIKEIFKAARSINQAKGYEREITLVLGDYCRFLHLLSPLLGEPAEKSETQRADIYEFQLAAAIRELFVSHTESCDAAAFLIRSLLELWIRRGIFRKDLRDDAFYAPTKDLILPRLLEACRMHGIRFERDYDTILLIWENLNLVVHLGLKLNRASLWYFFGMAQSMRVTLDRNQGESEEQMKRKLREMLDSLHANRLVEVIKRNVSDPEDAITIYWR
jgi:hypothetical protein